MSQDLDYLKDDFHYVMGNRGYLKAMQTDRELYLLIQNCTFAKLTCSNSQFDLLILLDPKD